MAGIFGPYSNHPSIVPGFVDNDRSDLYQEVPPPGPRRERSVSSRSHDSGYGGSSEGRSRLATPVSYRRAAEYEASAISPKGQAAPHPLGDHYCQAYTHHGHIRNNNCTTPFTANWDSATSNGRLAFGSNGHIAQPLPAWINVNGLNFGRQVNGSNDIATDEPKAECVADRGEKEKNLNDAPWCYSEGSVEASDEGEDDSDLAYEGITTPGGFRSDLLPSFLPYLHSQETNTPSPYADSPESGSSSSGTAGQDTPASSISYQSGRNGVRRLGQSPPGAATGSSNDSTPPTIVVEGEKRAKATARQPLPFICWYVAAGEACPAKYVKRSTETRHLWHDHAWGKDSGLNHRLPAACQLCHRLFLTQDFLNQHVAEMKKSGSVCPKLSSRELEEMNRVPNRRGISSQSKDAVEKIREEINREKGSPRCEDDTRILLKERVDSNISLYINGSNTSEQTARSELWKWYLIFKQLRPDDEVPLNPFRSKWLPENQSIDDALRIFDCSIDQLAAINRLPKFDRDARETLREAFRATLQILGADEAEAKSRSEQRTARVGQKRQRLSTPDPTPLLHPGYHTPAPPTPAPPTPAPAATPTATRNQGDVGGIVPDSGTAPTPHIDPAFQNWEAQQPPQQPLQQPLVDYTNYPQDYGLQQAQQHIHNASALATTADFSFLEFGAFDDDSWEGNVD